LVTRAQVLYDDDCGFCRWLLAKIVRWDVESVLEPVSLRSSRAAELLSEIDERVRLSSWHLVQPDGSVLSGGSAIAPLLDYLTRRRLRFFLIGAKIARSAPRTTEKLYGFVARNRHRFGRWLGEEACAVDPTEVAGRRMKP
ncbi:MAG: thiol-disulfide oxidoreductase DCC family protein, partial [Acidimicrobiia bacterium]